MFEFKFKTLTELIKTFPDEQKCIDFLEQILWNGNPVSPFDPTSKVYKCKNNRYRCKNTGKYFNVKTETIFENTKVSLQNWFIAIWMCMSHKGGLSSMELQRENSELHRKRLGSCSNVLGNVVDLTINPYWITKLKWTKLMWVARTKTVMQTRKSRIHKAEVARTKFLYSV